MFLNPNVHVELAQPSAWIQRWSHLLKPRSRVLDVACGSGRHMRWLGQQGHHCTGVDRSTSALQQAQAFGPVVEADLEQQPWPYAALPCDFDALVVTNYLWRPLFQDLCKVVAPGGIVLYETFSRAHAQFGKPSNPDFLLEPGELLAQFKGWYIVAYEDGIAHDPLRCVQRITAIKPQATPMACATTPTMPVAALSIESGRALAQAQRA
ncbi:MAG: class I SAM-dependent methyltransferase [Rhodoferax sp.]